VDRDRWHGVLSRLDDPAALEGTDVDRGVLRDGDRGRNRRRVGHHCRRHALGRLWRPQSQRTSGTWDLSDLTVNTSGGTAVNLNNAGTVNMTPEGTISLTSAAGPALTASTNTTPASLALSGTIDSVTTTSSPTTGISLTNTTGSLTLDDVNLTTSGTALTLNNANNVTVNNSGDADITVTGRAIDLTTKPT
jgi:hypothetical protein